MGWLFSDSAISPADETASTSAPSGSNSCESGLSGRVVNSCSGLPSQAALYTIILSSGAKRAERTMPRRNVSG